MIGSWRLMFPYACICIPRNIRRGGYRNPAVDNHRISQYLLYGPLPVSVATRMITCFRIGNPYLNISKRSKIQLLLGGPHVTNIYQYLSKGSHVFPGGFFIQIWFSNKSRATNPSCPNPNHQRLANHHCSVKLPRLRWPLFEPLPPDLSFFGGY